MNETFLQLRQKAERSVAMAEIDMSQLSELEIKNMIHDLEVHRIELEMQNDELQRANKELEQAKRKYVELFEFAPVGYLTLDRQYRITDANLTFAQLVGAPGKKILAVAFTDFICPDFQDAFHFAIGRLQETREKQTITMQLKHAEACVLWVHLEMTSRDKGQTYLVSISDVTRQKQVEQEIITLNNRIEAVMIAGNMAWWEMELPSGAVTFNENKATMIGFPPERFRHYQDFMELVHPEDYENTMDACRQHINDQKSLYECEYRIRTHENTYVWFHDIGRIVERKKDSLRLVGIAANVTERKKTEQLLQESKEKYRQLFDFMPVGISVSDSNGQLIESNQTSQRLLGVSKEEHEKRHIDGAEWSILRKDGSPMPPEEFASIRALKEQRLITNVEMGVKKGSETIIWINVNAVPLVSDPDKVIIAYTDITEKVQQEQRLAETLQEKEILLKEIHHRVKNNMQTIASLLYKQQQHTDDEHARKVLDDSIQRVKSMALIHEQIYRAKNLSRINLADYIRQFANKLLKTYRPKGSAITLTPSIEEVYLPVDASIPVALILNELIVNAFKYAFPEMRDGRIEIECRERAGEITLIVRDNGVGLPDNFEFDQTRTLGLYLVHNLATRQLGGSIELHRKDPTEFVMKFRTEGGQQ